MSLEISKNEHFFSKKLNTPTSFAAFMTTPRSGLAKTSSFSEKTGYFLRLIL